MWIKDGSDLPTHDDEAATRLRFNEFDDAEIEHIRETCGEMLAEGVDSPLLRAALDAAYRLAASLRSTRAALEEARRDSARIDWLEHQNATVRATHILPVSCGYSVRQFIDKRIAESGTPAFPSQESEKV